MARAVSDTASVRTRLTACLLTLAALVLLAAAGNATDPPPPDTKPPPLDRAAVARAARAFGIDAEPERTTDGWEAEDEVRSIYFVRAPSAWYVQFNNSSPLLGPPGDRTAICAADDPPEGCREPFVTFVADVGQPPPTEDEAHEAARRTLAASGLLRGRWDSFVMDPSRDPVPCRSDLMTPFPCTRQLVPTRAVMLTRPIGNAPAARWGVIVGPDGLVLSAVGRVAVAR